jgi:hypothetical protein
MDKTKFVCLEDGYIVNTDCIKYITKGHYHGYIYLINYNNNSEDSEDNDKLYTSKNDYENLHKILVKDVEYENEIKQLQDEIKILKDEIYYKPGGDGMKMAQEDYKNLENKNLENKN